MIAGLGGRVFLAVLLVFSVVIPLVALFAPLGMATILIVLGAVAVWACWEQKPWRWLLQGMGPWVLAVGAVGVVTAPFAIDPSHSARVAISFIIMGMLGVSLHHALAALTPRQMRLCLALWLGAVLLGFVLLFTDIALCGALIVDRVSGAGDICVSGRFVYKRGLTTLAFVSLPALMMLSRLRPGMAVWGLAVLIWGMAMFGAWWLGSETLTLVLLCAPMLAAAAVVAPRLCLRGLRWTLLAVIILVPVAASHLPAPGEWRPWGEDQVPSSLHHRLTIWQFSGQRFLDRPILGWGLDSARSIPGGEDRFVISNDTREAMGAARIYDEQFLPLHPHNLIVQWWLELGLLGGLCLCWGVWRLTASMALGLENRLETVWRVTLLGSVFVVSMFSFGAWQSWWLSTLWIVAAFLTSPRAAR